MAKKRERCRYAIFLYSIFNYINHIPSYNIVSEILLKLYMITTSRWALMTCLRWIPAITSEMPRREWQRALCGSSGTKQGKNLDVSIKRNRGLVRGSLRYMWHCWLSRKQELPRENMKLHLRSQNSGVWRGLLIASTERNRILSFWQSEICQNRNSYLNSMNCWQTRSWCCLEIEENCELRKKNRCK